MSDNQWAYDLGQVIYSIVKKKATEQLSGKYPNLYITNEDKSTQAPSFPTVYVKELTPVEVGQTLDGQSINGLRETIQIEVTSNKSRSEVRKVMSVVMDIMKNMRFQGTSLPEPQSDGEIYRSVARLSRVVGALDTL